MTVMESTAIIYCVKGSGGFAFPQSSQVTIYGFTLINCGAYNYDSDVMSQSSSETSMQHFLRLYSEIDSY